MKQNMLFIFCYILCIFITSGQHNFPTNSVIDNNKWLDTSGKFIHAHGGQIYEYSSVFYLIGTTQKENKNAGWTSEGVNCYSSTDLMSWKFENEIFHNSSIHPTDNNIAKPPWKMERPKILYNEKNNNFVMWFHLGSHEPYKDSITDVGLANCSTICGDYQWIGSFEPDGKPSYDMGLYQDGNKGYLVRSVNNSYAGISQLNNDYTNTTGITSKGARIEGVTIFLLNTYYLLGSHLSGWSPNAAELCTTKNDESTSINGAKWDNMHMNVDGLMSNPTCPNPTNSSKTYNGQSTYVIRLQDDVNKKYVFIAMFDIWNNPNVDNATYLWLPVQFSSNKAEVFPFIPDLKKWTINDYSVPIP
eukprot:178257_1